MNMRQTIEFRLEIIRSVREEKFKVVDYNINLLSDAGLDTTELRAYRQRLRDITEDYKTLLSTEGEISHDEENPLLAYEWDAFTSVDWN